MAGTGISANGTRPHVPAAAGRGEQSGRSCAQKRRAGARSEGPRPGASIPSIRPNKEAKLFQYTTRAHHVQPARRGADGRRPGDRRTPPDVDLTPAELAVRFGFRPWTVRAILLCGPAPIRHRRGRPLVRLDEFAAALDPRSGARDTHARKDAPSDASNITRGLNRHPYHTKGPNHD